MYKLLSRFSRDKRGASALEFALAAPVTLGLFFGILQFGVVLQSRGAIRSAISDIARTTSVEFLNSSSQPLSSDQIKGLIINRAISAPYLMKEANLDVTVTQVTEEIAGTVEFEVTASYSVPMSMSFIPGGAVPISVTRHIFLDDPTT